MSFDSARKTPHLVLGGARSGKSGFAESCILELPAPRVYLATAQVLDGEMRERVQKHRARRDASWETVECPVEVVEILKSLQHQGKPVLLDCLTLWLTNLLLVSQTSCHHAPEDAVNDLCTLLKIVDYPLVIVSNEVGWGIVPENSLARRFRDLAGYANQQVAAACRSVTLVAAGLPLTLK